MLNLHTWILEFLSRHPPMLMVRTMSTELNPQILMANFPSHLSWCWMAERKEE